MMKIIIPYWQGRVSPLFDAAGTVLVVDMAGGRELGRLTRQLDGNDTMPRIRQTMNLGADVLICGAISWQLECLLRSNGLQVISNICGPVDDVLAAFAAGALQERPFLMPGCQGIRRRMRKRHGGTSR